MKTEAETGLAEQGTIPGLLEEPVETGETDGEPVGDTKPRLSDMELESLGQGVL
jgi:hypothetical protein